MEGRKLTDQQGNVENGRNAILREETPQMINQYQVVSPAIVYTLPKLYNRSMLYLCIKKCVYECVCVCKNEKS